MALKKAIIIIGVSKYKSGLHDLPGTITSANRIFEWAKNEDYHILPITDKKLPLAIESEYKWYEEITVDLLRNKMVNFVSDNIIDRLIIYFAGHGIRSDLNNFWLLTNALDGGREGINVYLMRRLLQYYNIGKFSEDNLTRGQLCIIGDACRDSAEHIKDFFGDPIFDSKNTQSLLQTDHFFSTGLGEVAFELERCNGSERYCLFSDVLADCLLGKVRSAIQEEHHEFIPAVTNHSLMPYLDRTIPTLSMQLTNEEMVPDIHTGLNPPYNVYTNIGDMPPDDPSPGGLANELELSGEISVMGSRSMAPNNHHFNYSKVQIIKNDFEKVYSVDLNRNILTDVYENGEYQSPENETIEHVLKSRSTILDEPINRRQILPDCIENLIHFVSDTLPEQIVIPKNSKIKIDKVHGFFVGSCQVTNGKPIVLLFGKQCLLVPNFPGTIAVINKNLPGDILLFLPEDEYGEKAWDTILSDISALRIGSPLKLSQAIKFADKIRHAKHTLPHYSVTAGYLYEFSGDKDNIIRTAQYMARQGIETRTINGSIETRSILPFDLALLCTNKITWECNDYCKTYTDLPSVESITIEDNFSKQKPGYSRAGFESLKHVPLWGICPVYRQGWEIIRYDTGIEIPNQIRNLSRYIGGHSTVTFEYNIIGEFASIFAYEIKKITSDFYDNKIEFF